MDGIDDHITLLMGGSPMARHGGGEELCVTEPSLVFSSLSSLSAKRKVRHCRLALWQTLQGKEHRLRRSPAPGRERQYRLALHISLPTAELVCLLDAAAKPDPLREHSTKPPSSPLPQLSRNLGCDWRRDRPSSGAQFQHGLIPPPGLSPIALLIRRWRHRERGR